MPSLGWHPTTHPDAFDSKYQMSGLVPDASREKLQLLPQPVVWTPGPVLDQGNVPACVGFTGADHLNGQPHAMPDRDPGGLALYGDAQQNDSMPLPHDGSTIHGLLIALGKLGLAHPADAVWAHEEWTVRKFILTQGPVMVGTNWSNSMFNPDSSGIVRYAPSSGIAGGHAYSLIGYDWHNFGKPVSGNGLYKAMNHWGTGWAEGGFFYLTHGDVAALLADGGEACAIVNWITAGTVPAAQAETSSLICPASSAGFPHTYVQTLEGIVCRRCKQPMP